MLEKNHIPFYHVYVGQFRRKGYFDIFLTMVTSHKLFPNFNVKIINPSYMSYKYLDFWGFFQVLYIFVILIKGDLDNSYFLPQMHDGCMQFSFIEKQILIISLFLNTFLVSQWKGIIGVSLLMVLLYCLF